jgi:hypothetical protein
MVPANEETYDESNSSRSSADLRRSTPQRSSTEKTWFRIRGADKINTLPAGVRFKNGVRAQDETQERQKLVA